MRIRPFMFFFIATILWFMADATPCFSQGMQSHIGALTGHADGGGQGRPDRGKQLYRRYCKGCHGTQGDGNGENATWLDPKPRDFTSAVFKCRSTPSGSLPSDRDLFNSITRGFVNTNMPSWRSLTAQNRADLVAYIKTLSPRWKTEQSGAAVSIPPEPAASIAGILRGRELFEKLQCASCHGASGKGDGSSAAKLTDSKNNPIHPYNFSTGSRFKCGVSNEDLYRILVTGLDGTPMPSFADAIPPDGVWDLVHFLRTFQPIHTRETVLWASWSASHSAELRPPGADQSAGNRR